MEDGTDLGEVHVGGEVESDRAGRGTVRCFIPASTGELTGYTRLQYSTVQYSTVQYSTNINCTPCLHTLGIVRGFFYLSIRPIKFWDKRFIDNDRSGNVNCREGEGSRIAYYIFYLLTSIWN